MTENRNESPTIKSRVIEFFSWFPFDWDTIRKIGETRILKTAAPIAIVIPFLAKLLNEVPEFIKIPWLEEIIVLKMRLPFTWYFLFFAVVLATLGGLLLLLCPRIVKEYDNFADYESDSKGGNYLRLALYQISPLPKHKPLDDHLNAVRNKYSVNVSSHHPIIEQLKLNAAPEADTFNFIRDSSVRYRPGIRSMATCFYVSSFLLFAWVFLENLISVLQLIL